MAGCLKNRPGITYAYAKDQAVKDDIKNASARSRTRETTKVFNCKGTLAAAIEKALQTVEEWVADDVDKELYAKQNIFETAPSLMMSSHIFSHILLLQQVRQEFSGRLEKPGSLARNVY